jgi:tetratricopeptide (TPR) repeat protein
MNFHMSAAAVALACFAAAPRSWAQTPAPAASQAPAPTKLKVGDAAPALSVESFVQGTPVTALAKGKTYLLHFWAPWNKASVEQLQALGVVQKTYAEKGLVVLAIASTDVTGTTIEKVKAKLAELGESVQIAVAWDKGSSTKDAFLKAAGRTTLPCAVLVDKDGKIALIENAALGMQFFDAVTAGQHDLAALAAWQTKAERAPQTVKSLATAYQGRKWAEVLSYVDELLEVDPVGYGGNAQARMLAQSKSGAPEKAIEWAKAWVDGPGKDSPEGLNAVAWVLVDPAAPFPAADLDLAMRAAQRSADLTKNEDGAVLDTLARVHFLKGDVAKAIEVQKKAIEKLRPAQAQFKAQIEAALKEYEAALAKK